jgi:hypothetical protein
LVVLVVALVLVGSAPAADPYTIIKQRARSVANQPQPAPRPAPVQPVPPATPVIRPVTNAPPAAPALTAEQEAALQQVITDLNAIKPGAKPAPAQIARIEASLAALTEGEARPSPETLSQLAGALAAGWGSQKMTGPEQQRFARSLRRVLNSAASSAAEVESAVSGAKSTLKYSGMEDAATRKVLETLQAIAATAQP